MIPDELRALNQWVVWRSEERDGKATKVPYRPGSPSTRASSTDPESWGSLEEALAAQESSGADGIGFVFAEDDPYTGVDFDGCVVEGDEINSHVAALLEQLDSYTEYSPSGTGIHCIVRAELKGGRCSTAQTPWGAKYENYDHGRFF